MREELESFSDSVNLCNHLIEKFSLELSAENSVKFLKFCQQFCSKVSGKWKKSNRILVQFLKSNKKWLESPIAWLHLGVPGSEQLEESRSQECDHDNEENVPPTTPNKMQSLSQQKHFEDLTPRQKRRRVNTLNLSFSPEELTSSTLKSLKQSGQEEVGHIIEHLMQHPEDIQKVKTCIAREKSGAAYTPEKALGLFVSLELSKWQYINLKESASEQGIDIYPSYYKIKQAKQDCYPVKETVTVNEDGAEILLQALLDLTVTRIVSANNLLFKTGDEVVLTSKWGFDGASGQSHYKQIGEVDETTVFMASLVPLRLHSGEVVVWENDRPSSTMYCRPIMFKFMKETKDTVVAVKKKIEDQIMALQPTKVGGINVNHKLLLTMIDGKISSIISDTASAVCDICKAKPSEMNNLDNLKDRRSNEDMYQYGLSTLHAWIRCMECLLHIGMTTLFY